MIPDDAGADATTTPDGGADPDVPLVPASKVDLLVVVDNSGSMGDKSAALAKSLPSLVRRLAAVGDLHVGVISSSIGTLGGDVCPDTGDLNQRAHLLTRGASAPPNGVLTSAGGVDALAADTEAVVRGVGESGCGFEAPLEAAYRFLVQPDPWESVKLNGNNQATFVGVDATILAQRKAFLRPDSLLIVLTLSDEDESIADPLSVQGQGWAYMASQFPGNQSVFRTDGRTTTAPRGTSICATEPLSAGCTSCGFAASCNPADAGCAALKADPSCQGGGYYGPTDDSLNVRFHKMRQRFGIDPRYPVSRYVDGLSNSRVPKRDTSHDASGRYIGGTTCTNPIFAEALPQSASEELCTLKRGTRSRELVIFATLAGVPSSLLAGGPNWTAILGAAPERLDETGIDPHMIQSISPRAGLAPPSTTRGDNGADPLHGREFDTQKDDLQYACRFELQAPRNCTTRECDCPPPAVQTGKNPPLCGASADPNVGVQTHAKAYPTPRLLTVARDLSARGVVGSICGADPQNGYSSTMTAIGDKLAGRVAK